MKKFPYTILSCTMSLDGYIDDISEKRLILSNAKHFEWVDAMRASCDAILVGANTIRRDNPRLLIRSKKLQQERIEKGLPAHPIKLTLSSTGNFDPNFYFFSLGDSEKLVYTLNSSAKTLENKFSKQVQIIGLDESELNLPHILTSLSNRGVSRLFVEGGTSILTQFLQTGLVNELFVAIAPFFIGEKTAPRFVNPGKFPWDTNKRMRLNSIEQFDDTVVLKYMEQSLAMNALDKKWLNYAIDLSRKCPSTDMAFAVGAVIVDEDGKKITVGFSRETDPKVHAEESALQKITKQGINCKNATIYSSLEPCNKRLSRPKGCAQLIIDAGIKRVVFAATEPPVFVPGHGAAKLKEAGIETIAYPQLLQKVIKAQSELIQQKWRDSSFVIPADADKVPGRG